MKNQTIFELYTDDNKSKYSSNPMNILNSVTLIDAPNKQNKNLPFNSSSILHTLISNLKLKQTASYLIL